MYITFNIRAKVTEAQTTPLLSIPKILTCSCYNFIRVSNFTKLKGVAHTCHQNYSGGMDRTISALGVQGLPGHYGKTPVSEVKVKM